MSFPSNAHTHSTYCDGCSSIAETVAAARRLGFVSLGFSGHAYQGFDEKYSMTEGEQNAYFAELAALKEAGGTPRIWAGLELDYDACETALKMARESADYIIGSTHYMSLDFHGSYASVDGAPDALKRYLDEIYGGDGLALARDYFDKHVINTLAFRPEIIGHFDLIRKNARRLSMFDENGAEYRRIACHALERVFASGAVLEINTGGIARGYMDTPYPTFELMGAWREMGGRVTVSSDCHNASLLDFGFEAALDMLKIAGYKSVLRLGMENTLWDEVEL